MLFGLELSNQTGVIAGGVCLGAGLIMWKIDAVKSIPVVKFVRMALLIIGVVMLIYFSGNMLGTHQGFCDFNNRTGQVSCDYYGERPGWMKWNMRKSSAKDNEMATTNEVGGYHKVGDRYYKNKYMPETNSKGICPPGFNATVDGECVKHFSDGARTTAEMLTCAQSSEYPVKYPERGTCRKECKSGYEWNNQRCVKICHPSMTDFGTYCAASTVNREVTSSKVPGT